MDIFLSINRREQVIKLPVLPREISISDPQNNQTYNTINQGTIKLIGLEGLKAFSIQSFFPAQEYYFVKDKTYTGIEYIEILEEWKERRVPIRVTIPEMSVNLAMAIDDIQHSIRDGTGDIYYTLDLEEFKFIEFGRKRAGV